MLNVGNIFACPSCHNEIMLDEGKDLACNKCNFIGAKHKNIISTLKASSIYFDELHTVMTENNDRDTVYRLCYEKQSKLINEMLKPGMVVVDVGCGPAVSYSKPDGVTLIGIEPSLSSLASNKALDVHLHSSATAIPLKDNSVDVIICMYSIHHMIGNTVNETKLNVENAFKEFNRIIKPKGEILIFEVNPWRPFFVAEQLGWNTAKRLLKSKWDFYFWSQKALQKLGSSLFQGSKPISTEYNIGWTETFPPAFSLQWLKIPRFLYPFDVKLHRWSC